MLAFFYEGVYRGFWTYVSTEDLTKYVKPAQAVGSPSW